MRKYYKFCVIRSISIASHKKRFPKYVTVFVGTFLTPVLFLRLWIVNLFRNNVIISSLSYFLSITFYFLLLLYKNIRLFLKQNKFLWHFVDPSSLTYYLNDPLNHKKRPCLKWWWNSFYRLLWFGLPDAGQFGVGLPESDHETKRGLCKVSTPHFKAIVPKS